MSLLLVNSNGTPMRRKAPSLGFCPPSSPTVDDAKRFVSEIREIPEGTAVSNESFLEMLTSASDYLPVVLEAYAELEGTLAIFEEEDGDEQEELRLLRKMKARFAYWMDMAVHLAPPDKKPWLEDVRYNDLARLGLPGGG